jgi:hypothetical protein
MRSNDLCHIYCYMGHASVATRPTLVGYGLVQLS